MVGLVVRRRGDLDIPGCRNDLGSTCQDVVLGQDVVDVLAELESTCLFGLAASGVVSLDLHTKVMVLMFNPVAGSLPPTPDRRIWTWRRSGPCLSCRLPPNAAWSC